MKVLIVGAAGRTGRAVVDRAVTEGHEVTAFVHNDAGYDVPGVEVRAGDASDMAAIGAAIVGQDAVIDTVGGKTPYKSTTLEASVVTSSIGVGDSSANSPFFLKILLATFLRGSSADKAKMESAVRGSESDWVITRPSVLTEKPATGDVRIFSVDNRDKAHSITRADLAAFLVAQLTSNDHLRQAVTIANR